MITVLEYPNTHFLSLLDASAWTLADVTAVISIIIGGLGLLFGWWPLYKQKRAQRLLEKSFGADFYSKEIIEDAARYYIRPNCSSIDPTQEAEIRYVISTEEDLFTTVDRFLANDSSHRHLLLLADSGMGKSSFVLSYYARNQRLSKSRRQRLAIVPLGIPDALSEISKIDDKKNTIIFLDAFDEDTKAIKDHHQRLIELMEACTPFKRVLLTSRTQFFNKDEEIPKQTGIAVVKPRKPGESGVYEFWKLYLTPLNDDQVEEFIRKRYPFRRHLWWTREMREEAQRLVRKIPLLSVRPMLLAYIPDVIESGAEVTFTFQLYEIMVEEWLKRERRWIEKDVLREFSENLAVDLYINRQRRKSERIPRAEFTEILQRQGVSIDHWKYTARSLLNRDANGNLKFAHRSIMEYLFVKRFVEGDDKCKGIEWTDLMITFLDEIIHYNYDKHRSLPEGIEPSDLFSIPNFNLTPLHELRAEPAQLTSVSSITNMMSSSPGEIFFNPLPLHILGTERHCGRTIIKDFTTGLAWEQSGSSRALTFEEAEQYIVELNSKMYWGRDDWRLPTYDEVTYVFSLDDQTGIVYLDQMFDREQYRIWTSDKSNGQPLVSFTLDSITDLGSLMDAVSSYNRIIPKKSHVRAVCSLVRSSRSVLQGEREAPSVN
ncbi:MAG: hypothetical protein QOH25_1004 [Acidobacteriota bacterium]|jgi:hypothetical protein|nr:hypothetical protein [Acidobacteriota bacterium]